MKRKEIKETHSWIKEHIRELHLSATFVRGLFGELYSVNSSRALLFLEGQKNICRASLDVRFHKLSNCYFKNVLSLFLTEIS